MMPIDSPLDERLFDCSYDFDFFQAVRLLHLIMSDREGVGRIAKPGDEPVRFQVRQSLEFPASSIHTISAESDPPRMTTAFMGLTGVQGVLPHHYTEYVLARAQAKDYTLAAFFDLFNHRILSLFYRAWEKHSFPTRFQLAAAKSETDAFTDYLYDWIGLGTNHLLGRMAVQDQALLRYAGLFGQRPASAISLAAFLRDYFDVDVAIEQFVGAWYALSEDDQCDLASDNLNNELGQGAIAGDAVWDPQGGFRVKLGPLPLARFVSFLPGSKAEAELNDLVRFYVGPIWQFDLQLILRAHEVPWCRLGDETPSGPRLGWCGWLKTEVFEHDACDAIFAMN